VSYLTHTLFALLIISYSSRPYVQSLTRDLKHAATFQGFDTFQLAAENYNRARSVGLVNIRRLPGDDLQYGPESEGMQDIISL
jgi:hypothetical protein